MIVAPETVGPSTTEEPASPVSPPADGGLATIDVVSVAISAIVFTLQAGPGEGYPTVDTVFGAE